MFSEVATHALGRARDTKILNIRMITPGRPLRLFTSRSYLPDGAVALPLLRPFWPDLMVDESPLNQGRFDRYYARAQEIIELVDLRECDAAVYPTEWQPRQPNPLAHELAALARKAGKPCLLFSISDCDDEVNVPGCIVFRTSLNASHRKSWEHAMPVWSVDFAEKYLGGTLQPRTYTSTPTVGYTGYIDYLPAATALHTFARRLKHGLRAGPASRLRGRVVRVMLTSDKVLARIIPRAGGMTGLATAEQRDEYVRNILDSDYCIVCRGGGNYSYRLYEVMSCGRIPLFINTDCVLPFEEFIDWRRIMCWVEYRDIDRAADLVIGFHKGLGAEGFVNLQRRVREIYENWLRPDAFYSNIWRYIPGLNDNNMPREPSY